MPQTTANSASIDDGRYVHVGLTSNTKAILKKFWGQSIPDLKKKRPRG
jgi:hypothetical protein